MTATIIHFPTLEERDALEIDRFGTSSYTGALDEAAALWQDRAVQEMHSLALFTELTSQLHLLGAPLDWTLNCWPNEHMMAVTPLA